MGKIILFLALLLNSLTSAKSQNIRSVPASAFAESLKGENVQLLDVRTLSEYNSGHITGALLADWMKPEEFRTRVNHLDRSKPLFVYCASGGRSSQAVLFLRKSGFSNIVELDKGFISWKKANLPVETVTPQEQMNREQFRSMVESKTSVLVDFSAEWCPPCRKMEPLINQLQSEGIEILKIEAGIHTDLVNQLNVTELPTFIYYKNGVESARMSGVKSLNELKEFIK